MRADVTAKNNIFKIFQRKILKDEFLRHTAIMLVGTKLGDIFNFIYRLAMIRLLTVKEYGTLNSLISFSMIVLSFSPFQPALTKFIAGYTARQEWPRIRFIVRRSWRDIGTFSLIILAIFLMASGWIAAFLKITETPYVALLGFFIAGGLIISVPTAFIQGAQLFVPLAYLSASSALFKLLVGVGLVLLGQKLMIPGLAVGGALGGYLIAPLSVILIGIIVIKKHFVRHLGIKNIDPAPITIFPVYRYFLPTALVIGSFWTLTNIDIILVKHFFSDQAAGSYSVAQMVGLIILFLPGTITLVLYPKAASSHAKNVSSRVLLIKGLVIVAIFCLPAALICGVFPGQVLTVISGKSNPQSNELVLWFSLAMSLYALSMLVIYYHLAVHNTKIVLPLILLAAAETGAISLYHPTLISVLYIVFGYSVMTFIVSLFMLRHIPSDRKPTNERADVDPNVETG
ncbi:MAG: hypothetical protein V1789_00145 [PVC group bacterium]